jgi:hypothetical protein
MIVIGHRLEELSSGDARRRRRFVVICSIEAIDRWASPATASPSRRR